MLLLQAGANYNACLHVDSLSFDDVIILLTVWNVIMFQSFECIARLCFYSAFFYYITLILSCCEILF